MWFFFSSRRRHTRWPRDWSSDVCSSDLSESRIQLSPEEFILLMEVITQYGVDMKKLDVEQEKVRMNARLLENLRYDSSSVEIDGSLDTLSLEKIENGELSIAAALLDRMMKPEKEKEVKIGRASCRA